MITKKGDVLFAKGILLKEMPVAILRSDCLRSIDQDNYHHKSKSLGVDKELLFSPRFKYRFMTFKFYNRIYVTLHNYFQVHSKERELYNGRKMLFLPLTAFGLAKSIKWEENLKSVRDNLDGLDVFQIFEEQRKRGMHTNILFNLWYNHLSKSQSKQERNRDNGC